MDSTYIATCQGGMATSAPLTLAMLALCLLCLPCLTAAGHQQLHKLMNNREKQFYFGEEEPREYEVIEVFRLTPDTANLARDTKDVHFHAMGQQFKLQLSPNKRLMAPQVFKALQHLLLPPFRHIEKISFHIHIVPLRFTL